MHDAQLLGDVQGLLKIGGMSGILTDSLLPLTSPSPTALPLRQTGRPFCAHCPGGGLGAVVAAGDRGKGVYLCLTYHKELALRETGRAQCTEKRIWAKTS